MSTLTHTDELLRRKRELHLRIGRSRRRIGRRLRAVGDDARRLVDWRTYVVRYPGWALAAALGTGMAASNALRPATVSRWLSRSLVHKALDGIRHGLTAELHRLWADSNPNDSTRSDDE